MRKLAACLGPDVINHTFIFAVEKCARHRLQHVIVVFVDAQVLRNELLRLQPEMLGDPFDIGGREQRPGRFAAVCAGEAIGPGKFGIVQFLHCIIEIFWRLLFELVEILFAFVMLIFGQLRKIF